MERLIRSACGTKYKKTKRQKTNKYHSKTLSVYKANHNQWIKNISQNKLSIRKHPTDLDLGHHKHYKKMIWIYLIHVIEIIKDMAWNIHNTKYLHMSKDNNDEVPEYKGTQYMCDRIAYLSTYMVDSGWTKKKFLSLNWQRPALEYRVPGFESQTLQFCSWNVCLHMS